MHIEKIFAFLQLTDKFDFRLKKVLSKVDGSKYSQGSLYEFKEDVTEIKSSKKKQFIIQKFKIL